MKRIFLIAVAFLVGVMGCRTLSALGQAVAPSAGQTARDLLKRGMADSNPERRKLVAVSMSLAGPDTDASPLLIEAIHDKDVQVGVAACASLGEMKEKRAIPALQQALDGEIPEVSFAAARALLEIGDPAGEDAVIQVLAKQKKTSSGLITREKRDATHMLNDHPGLIKYAAKEGIGFAPIPGLGIGMASAHELMKNSGISPRALAALLLARQKDDESLDALRDALGDNDWSVRSAAVHSVALRDRPDTLSDLAPLLDDKKPEVRFRAAAAYLRLEKLGSHHYRRAPSRAAQ
jgi:HEAT repeat protein